MCAVGREGTLISKILSFFSFFFFFYCNLDLQKYILGHI